MKKKIENVIRQGQPIAIFVRNGWIKATEDKTVKDVGHVDLIKALNGKYEDVLVNASVQTPFIELKDFISFLKDSNHKLKGIGLRSPNSSMLGQYVCIKNGEELTYINAHPKENVENFMQVYLPLKNPTAFNQDTEFIIDKLLAHVGVTIFLYFDEYFKD